MTRAEVEREIASLGDLPRSDLIRRWKALYDTDPPRGISRTLLSLAVAYQIQASHYGGLVPLLQRRLVDAAEGKRVTIRVDLSAGTRLVREWNGETHVVDVVDGGYRWKDKTYRSLSAVARQITGARWSGPRFFGLDERGAS